ncbi:uncharacterized protein LOC119433007 [Dermacentor silvarum]|uniref:uncharacterized protein LOC119433007 n=1 Tax=Dermacentor silvarum TaxID=543639 RepID=UPI00189A9D3D|nr:uncharacterized protein LOC119433007 [Dermacentor silvarum]
MQECVELRSRAVVRVSPGANRRPPNQQECVEFRSRAVVRGSPGTTRRPPSQHERVELRSRAVVRVSPGATRRPPNQQAYVELEPRAGLPCQSRPHQTFFDTHPSRETLRRRHRQDLARTRHPSTTKRAVLHI